MDKQVFVIELYDCFHKILLEPVKDFEEIQTAFQSIFKILFRKHKGAFSEMPRKHELYTIYEDLVKLKKLEKTFIFETILTSKLVRSSSGVLPISIALSGAEGSCDSDCSMCPNECKANGADQDIARSYLSSEGTFIRGKIQKFNICEQIWRRLAELEAMGHPPDKLEFIVLGGTFDCFPREYRLQTALDMFYACNLYQQISIRFNGRYSDLLTEWIQTNPFATNSPLSIKLTEFLYSIRERPLVSGQESQKQIDRIMKAEQLLNTKSKCCRMIGMVLETRPDRINRYSLTDLRKLGCTRIQIGIQSDNDNVLAYNNRGHTFDKSVKAIAQIRDNGFKIDGHLMPDLPSTTLEIDYEMVRHIFYGDDAQLDYCKIYPCLDLPYTQIRKWKESGAWQPIAENRFPEFLDFLAYTMSIVPPWTRVNRVQRDFPEASDKNNQLGFVSDTIRSNLQQMVSQHMQKKGMKCYDIRSREVRNGLIDNQLDRARLYVRIYRANEGTEFFLSVEIPQSKRSINYDFNDTSLLGLCRLRIPDYEFSEKTNTPFHYLPVYRKRERIARIRELHVYGNIATFNTRQENGNSQHRGIGKFLMKVAECIAGLYECSLVTVISGIGVRDYYENIGYTLDDNEDQYMVKTLLPNVQNSNTSNTSNNLVLFGKYYDVRDIQSAVMGSKISTKYITNNMNNRMDTHLYEKYDYGHINDAQGFSFSPILTYKYKSYTKYIKYILVFLASIFLIIFVL
uniref:tRNA carboxymethyluridine synthase n=1 Tax=viral metagenome TaxID=1070528 RepID=A0A6C0KI52_9ZZZZ